MFNSRKYLWFAVAFIVGELGSIKGISGMGVLYASQYGAQLQPVNRVLQSSPFEAKIAKIWVTENDIVKKGQKLMTLTRKIQNDFYREFTLRSNIAGAINNIYFDVGDEINSVNHLVEIVDISEITLEIEINHEDAEKLRQGKIPYIYNAQTEEKIICIRHRLPLFADEGSLLIPVFLIFKSQPALVPGVFYYVNFD